MAVSCSVEGETAVRDSIRGDVQGEEESLER